MLGYRRDIVLQKNRFLILSPTLERQVNILQGGRESNEDDGTQTMLPVILTVYLSDSQQMLTEVPVTPATRVVDVVEFCKEAGEKGCHLSEVWGGQERILPQELYLFELLQQWGVRRPEVSFYLRHHLPGMQGSPQPLEPDRTAVDGEPAPDCIAPCVELTLSELQEMATRQQQQIEAQQQMLVAKEQRLKYLQHGGKPSHGYNQSEAEKLRRLRERVESQEAKLKKIRAMRGQVDYSKLINGNLSAEIEHVSGLFQEKQAELQSAVLRVDQLTQQLEDLRWGRLHQRPAGPQQEAPSGSAGPEGPPATLELRKLYQELQGRNQQNVEQSSKLAQTKVLLNKRNAQLSVTDKRIGDLRERLHKKRAELGRPAPGSGLPPQGGASVSGRVAAVCPYIQVPSGGHRELRHPLSADPSLKHAPASYMRSQSANEASWSSLSKDISDWRTPSPEQLPLGYGTYPSATHHAPGHHCATSSLPRSVPGTHSSQRRATSDTSATVSPTSSILSSSPSQKTQQRTDSSPAKQGPLTSPAKQSDRPEHHPPAPPAAAVRPYVPEQPSRPQSPRRGPVTMNSSSIYSMYLQQPQAKGSLGHGSLGHRATVKAVYGKPILPSPSSTPPSPVSFLQGGVEGGASEGQAPLPPSDVDGIPRPLSPTKLTPVAHTPLRYQGDVAELDVLLRRRLSNAPRPLKKRSSITEPEAPQGPNIQKLLYQRFNTLAGGMEGAGGHAFFCQPTGIAPLSEGEEPGAAAEDAGPKATLAVTETTVGNTRAGGEGGASPSTGGSPERLEDPNNNNNHHHKGPTATQSLEALAPSSSPSPPSPLPPPALPPSPVAPCLPVAPVAPGPPKAKRTNLKKPSSERTGHKLRVKFNPLALLLDASLEGEFDLVQRIIYEVENPSTPNDEGITPLHNAVCAGHQHIVKFLLEFGVNVNAADSDGWTPLHCAASCNSVHLCKMLVEYGAAIFATTISDVETAADKCEEMEGGYTQCSQFLHGVQEKLGVMNKGTVYSLWDYAAQQPDELSFAEGDALTVLRRRDDAETEWWWAKLKGQEGYVPRNLLGLYPRIKPRQRSLA